MANSVSDSSADAFVEEHRPMVRSLAHKLRAQLDLTCELEELIAFGFHGLIEAKSRFDPARGVQFKTFAYYRIRGAMLDGIRKMAYMSRRAYAQLKLAEAADAIGEQLEESKAKTALGSAEDIITSVDETLGKLTAAYVMACVGQSDDAAGPGPEEEVSAVQERHRIREAIRILPEREAAIIQGCYFDGRTLDDVAKELGVSKSWASRIHTKALGTLKAHLEET